MDTNSEICYFNSIKVRLRPLVSVDVVHYSEFQFHKGAIETTILPPQRLDEPDFNSIKVRLRPPCLEILAHVYLISIP